MKLLLRQLRIAPPGHLLEAIIHLFIEMEDPTIIDILQEASQLVLGESNTHKLNQILKPASRLAGLNQWCFS